MFSPLLDKIITGVRLFHAFLTKLFKYYVIFPKAVSFIWGLILVHSWVEYALIWNFIFYLSNDLLHLPKAASIVNVLDGTTAVLVLLIAYASDTYLGPFLAVVSTTIAYISGLLLLYFSAGRLKSIEMQLLYAALILVALGRAGRDVPLKEFLADQCWSEGSSEDEIQVESRRKILWRSAYIMGIIASVYVLTDASWIKLCKVSTIAIGTAFALFLGGTAFYERKKPVKSTLHDMLRVVYAAIKKRHLSHTSDYDHILNIQILRWLEKAAIEESSHNPEDQARSGRICTAEQIQEVKNLLSMVPLWATILVYGLLQATGNTFFLEQFDYMDKNLGKISNVPAVIFVIIKTSTSFIVSRLCDSLFPSYWGEKTPRHVMLVRVAVGMAVSPICCIVARRIEIYRMLKDISISFLWLIPQFFLLGLMEGLVFDGMEEIYLSQVPKSLQKYGPSFTLFALNIGYFTSLVFILIFRNLFNDDLNVSKLGVYYRNLAYVCFVNLLIYCYVAKYYLKHEETTGDQGTEQSPLEQLQSLEEGQIEQTLNTGERLMRD